MRRQIKYLLTAAAAALLASCSGEDYQDMDTIQPGGTQEIRFEMVYATATAVAVTDTPQTRVATSTDGNYTSNWTNGDEVGVYIVKGSGGLQASGNWVDNMKMTYNSGNWTYTFPSGTEYYPSDGELLHFYAYYPYVSSLANPTNFTFSVQTDQSTAENLSKSDLLMASTMNVGKSGNPVQLAFSHVFTMVEMSATSGGVGGQMSANVVPTLEGCRTDATVHLAAGTATTTGNVGAITMYRVEQPADANYLTKYTYRALVPAQAIAANTELFRFSQTQGTITRSLSHKPSAQVALTRGEVKPYSITLQPTIDPNHAYAVGDYYPYNGLPVLGVVFEVSNGGKNGKIVDSGFIQRLAPVPGNPTAPIRWGDPAVNEQEAGVTGIRDMGDGYTGTKNLIIKYKDQGSKLADTYCIFNWIYITKNNGDVNGMWYLPAVNELLALRSLRSTLNPIITDAGGSEIMPFNYYRAMTEENASHSYYVDSASGLYQSPYTKSEANWNSMAVAAGKF